MKAWLERLLQLPPAAFAGWTLWRLLQDAQVRRAYPFDIEWMEGGMLAHVWRIREGLGLYTEPSADWIPYIYPPGYPALLAALGEPNYATARLVSLLFCLLASACVAGAARKEGAPWGLALGGAGLFLSCWEDSGWFYDLTRADSLAVGLAGLALLLGRLGAIIPAGLALAAAYVTKHNFAAFGLPMIIWFYRNRGKKEALTFLAASAGPALAATAGIEVWAHGNFLKYILGVPGSHPLNGERFFPNSELELMKVLAWTSGGGLLGALSTREKPDEGGRYWLGALAVALVLSILMRAHIGGFTNVLMQGHLLIAICGVLGLSAAVKRWGLPASVLASALVSWQIWDGRWEGVRHLPTDRDRESMEQVVEAVREIDGEVFAPQFAWIPYQAGKTPSMPLISLWDIDYERGPFYSQPSVVEQAARAHRWPAILSAEKEIKHGVAANYDKTTRLKINGGTTRSGWSVRPAWILTPKNPAPDDQ